MNRKKLYHILIIDFKEFTVNFLKDYYSKVKYAECIVDTAENQYTALAKINNNEYDFIFIDFALPEMIKPIFIKSFLKVSPDTKIIIISNMYSDQIYTLCLKYKIYPEAFINKPITLDGISKLLLKVQNG